MYKWIGENNFYTLVKYGYTTKKDTKQSPFLLAKVNPVPVESQVSDFDHSLSWCTICIAGCNIWSRQGGYISTSGGRTIKVKPV